MNARERFEKNLITTEQFEKELERELVREQARPKPTAKRPKRKRRYEIPWDAIMPVLFMLAVAAMIAAILLVPNDNDPSVSATCAAHGGVSRVDEVTVDGFGHAIICRDGYSRTFSGGVSP
jgi:hypothetical protein